MHVQPAHSVASRALAERPLSLPESTALAPESDPIALLPARIITRRPLPLEQAEDAGSTLDDPRLVLLSEPDSPRAASFRLLRDNILARQAPRIIAVSSGAPGEGKTTCAVNLALALRENGRSRVALIDGNFFGPSLGEIFRIDASTAAAPAMNLPWLLPYRIAEVASGLHVAAIVRPRNMPAPTFSRRWFDAVIAHLSACSYDHIVIDAAALDGSPEITQVVGVADGTLLTARSGGTTGRSLRRAAEQLSRARTLGVALMDGDL